MNKSYQPASANEVLEPLLTDLIDAGRKQEGAGSSNGTADNASNGMYTGFLLYTYDDADELHRLLNVGIPKNSKKIMERFARDAKGVPLS